MRLTVFCNYLLHNPGCSGTKGMLTQKRKKKKFKNGTMCLEG